MRRRLYLLWATAWDPTLGGVDLDSTLIYAKFKKSRKGYVGQIWGK